MANYLDAVAMVMVANAKVKRLRLEWIPRIRLPRGA